MDDISEIIEYLEKDSPHYARNVATRCFQRADNLLDQPAQGRRVPEYEGERDIREVFVHNWRLIYENHQQEIRLLAVIHSARLLSKTLEL